MAFTTKGKNELKPPSISYGMHLNALARLRQHGVQDNLMDGDVVRGNLSKDAYLDLMRAWRSLGLVSTNGEPEEALRELVSADRQHSQQILREILASSYPFLFGPTAESVNLEELTVQELAHRFEQQGISRKSVPLYVLFFTRMAYDAGLPLPKGSVGEPNRLEPEASLQKGDVTDHVSSKQSIPTSAVVANAVPRDTDSRLQLGQLLLSKLPDFNPKWKNKLQREWFLSFNQILHIVQGQQESQA